MSERRDPSSYRDFDELMDRLDAIVGAVKSKDVTIEESLDLLEEGIELGLRATDLVEKPDFTRREQAAMAESETVAVGEGGDGATSPDASDDDVSTGGSPDSSAGDSSDTASSEG